MTRCVIVYGTFDGNREVWRNVDFIEEISSYHLVYFKLSSCVFQVIILCISREFTLKLGHFMFVNIKCIVAANCTPDLNITNIIVLQFYKN